MVKNELFRKINGQFPDIVERTIGLWGTPELDVYLLDLISDQAVHPRAGLTAEHLAALDGLKRVHDAEYPQFIADEQSAALLELDHNPDFRTVDDSYHHVGRRIRAAWGHASFRLYMDTLFNDNRGGKRHGFPEAVAMALFRLSQEHEKRFPQFTPKGFDVWTMNGQV